MKNKLNVKRNCLKVIIKNTKINIFFGRGEGDSNIGETIGISPRVSNWLEMALRPEHL